MNDLTSMTLSALSAALEKRDFSAAELARAYLENAERDGVTYGAFVNIFAEQAIKNALSSDAKRAAGERLSVLSGIPYALKDNICTAGLRTTAASRMLENFVPCYSASVYRRLDEDLAVLLGKANMDEFAMGSTTENSAFRITKNPFDLRRSPGGSSGGPAAAVASCEAAFALGSDTGGSIRQPAAHCGVVGMSPTYGSVSRYGLIPFSSSLDRIGPITRTVKDNALVFGEIAFRDPRDPTSVDFRSRAATFEASYGKRRPRVGFDESLLSSGVSEDVARAVRNALAVFAGAGAETVEVSLPSFSDALPAYYIISSCEAYSNLSRYDGIRYGLSPEGDFGDVHEMYEYIENRGFGREVLRRMEIGEKALSVGFRDEYYLKAEVARTRLKKEFADIFRLCDVFISPVAPDVAPFLVGAEKSPEEVWLSDAFTVPESLCSLPALSLPCGLDPGGMPIGIQIVGPAFSENVLYRAGEVFEEASGITFDGLIRKAKEKTV